MKNLYRFKERFLVFDKADGGVDDLKETGARLYDAADAGISAAVNVFNAPSEGVKAAVKDESGQERDEVRTDVVKTAPAVVAKVSEGKLAEARKAFEGLISAKFTEVMAFLALPPMEFKGEVPADLNFSDFEKSVSEKFAATSIDDEKTARIKELLKDSDQSIKDLFTKEFIVENLKVFSAPIVKTHFEKAIVDPAKYPLFKEFMVDAKTKNLNPMPKLNYTVKVDEKGNVLVTLESQNDFDDKYQKFTKTVDAKDAKTPEEAAQQSAEEIKAQKRLELKKKMLKNSFLGGIIISLFKSKDESDDAALTRIISGGNVFATIIIGALGGGFLIEGGQEAYNDALSNLSETNQAVVKGVQGKLGFLSMQKQKEKFEAELAKIEAGKGVSLEPLKIVEATFKEKIEKGFVGDRDVVLENPYDLAQGKLEVDLTTGGEITIPKGEKLMVDGKETDPSNEKVLKEGKVVLTSKIPKGTRFSTKVKFKLEVPAEAKA